MNKNTFVISKNDEQCYMITSDTVQTRGRRQVCKTGYNKATNYQIAEKQLIPVTDFEASLWVTANKILRGKHAMSANEASIVRMYRLFKKQVLA